jgi:hypothetical protein
MEEKKVLKKSTLISRIKKILKDQGDYFPGLDFMIEITAGNLYAYYIIIRDVEALTNTEITEVTREGNEKKKTHPVLAELRKQTETVRRCLRELKLTLATIEGVSDDEMEDLMSSVNDVK